MAGIKIQSLTPISFGDQVGLVKVGVIGDDIVTDGKINIGSAEGCVTLEVILGYHIRK